MHCVLKYTLKTRPAAGRYTRQQHK